MVVASMLLRARDLRCDAMQLSAVLVRRARDLLYFRFFSVVEVWSCVVGDGG